MLPNHLKGSGPAALMSNWTRTLQVVWQHWLNKAAVHQCFQAQRYIPPIHLSHNAGRHPPVPPHHACTPISQNLFWQCAQREVLSAMKKPRANVEWWDWNFCDKAQPPGDLVLSVSISVIVSHRVTTSFFFLKSGSAAVTNRLLGECVLKRMVQRTKTNDE